MPTFPDPPGPSPGASRCLPSRSLRCRGTTPSGSPLWVSSLYGRAAKEPQPSTWVRAPSATGSGFPFITLLCITLASTSRNFPRPRLKISRSPSVLCAPRHFYLTIAALGSPLIPACTTAGWPGL